MQKICDFSIIVALQTELDNFPGLRGQLADGETTVFSITGVLLCIISAALGIYTAKLDKLHLQLIENGTKVKGLVEKVYLQKYTRYRRQIPYRILYSFTYHDKVYYHKSRLVWEKPDLKKGDLITVYVNNLGKSTVYNCNEAV